jgi:hypothetical protein
MSADDSKSESESEPEPELCDPTKQTTTGQFAIKWKSGHRPEDCKDFLEKFGIEMEWKWDWPGDWSVYQAEDVETANAIMEDISASIKGAGVWSSSSSSSSSSRLSDWLKLQQQRTTPEANKITFKHASTAKLCLRPLHNMQCHPHPPLNSAPAALYLQDAPAALQLALGWQQQQQAWHGIGIAAGRAAEPTVTCVQNRRQHSSRGC